MKRLPGILLFLIGVLRLTAQIPTTTCDPFPHAHELHTTFSATCNNTPEPVNEPAPSIATPTTTGATQPAVPLIDGSPFTGAEVVLKTRQELLPYGDVYFEVAYDVVENGIVLLPAGTLVLGTPIVCSTEVASGHPQACRHRDGQDLLPVHRFESVDGLHMQAAENMLIGQYEPHGFRLETTKYIVCRLR